MREGEFERKEAEASGLASALIGVSARGADYGGVQPVSTGRWEIVSLTLSFLSAVLPGGSFVRLLGLTHANRLMQFGCQSGPGRPEFWADCDKSLSGNEIGEAKIFRGNQTGPA